MIYNKTDVECMVNIFIITGGMPDTWNNHLPEMPQNVDIRYKWYDNSILVT